MLAFCNAHTVNMARQNAEFAQALDQALVLNDGIGVEIGSRLVHGAGFPANLNGTDFTPALLRHVETPLRIFLLGSRPGVAERAGAMLVQQFPRHQIVGTRDGFFPPSDDRIVAADIAASGADLVLVGMGHPLQEFWASAHWRSLPAVTMCIGAFLDFTARVVPRAPRFIRAIRAEWLYRLAWEPRRLARRYIIGNITFLALCLAERLRGSA